MNKLVVLLLLGAVLVVQSKRRGPIQRPLKVLPRNASDADLAAADEDAVKVDGCCKAEIKNSSLRFIHNVGGNCTFKIDHKFPGFLSMYVKKADNDLDITYTNAAGTQELEVRKKKFSGYATGTFSMGTSNPNAFPNNKTVLVVNIRRRMCHKTYTATAAQQRVTSPGFKKRRYNSNKYCEWWIQAEEGKRIQLDFNSFNIGAKTANCTGGDYLAVAKTGDKTYTEQTRRLCGPSLSDIPNTIQSVSNKMKVLFIGKDGGEGFCFKFKAID